MTEHLLKTSPQTKSRWLLLPALACAALLWQYWPQLLLQAISIQRELNGQLSDLLYDIQENQPQAMASFAMVSFVYGVLHSLGPGHGKVIVATYLTTQQARVKTSLLITVASSLLQAIVAIGLVSVLLLAFTASMREVHAQAELAIKVSYFCVFLLGATISFKAIRALKTGCNHARDTSSGSGKKEIAGLILAIGLRPCTGAIMVLLFANMAGLYYAGVVSALLMAVGTCLTTSVIALLALAGKKAVVNDEQDTAEHRVRRPVIWLKLAGGLVVTLTGFLLLKTAGPAMATMVM